MATDPYAAPGSEDLPKLYSSVPVPDATYVAKVSPEVFTKPKAGGGGGGGPSQRQRDDAKKHKEDAAWEAEHEAAMQRANQNPEEVKAKPRLDKPRLLGEKLTVGGIAKAYCDTLDGAKSSSVNFELFALDGKGQWQEVNNATGCGAPITLYPGSGTDPKAGGKYKLVAKHHDAKAVESPVYEALPADPFQGLIFFSPLRQEYLVLDTEEEAQPWLEAIEKTASLSQQIHQAWQIPDPKKRCQAMSEAAEKAEKLFGGESVSKSDSPEERLEELLHVAGNPRKGVMKGLVHIAAHDRAGKPVTGYWRKETDKTLKKKVDEALKRDKSEGKPKPLWKGKIKATFLAAPMEEGQWPIPWKLQKSGKDGEVCDWSIEAATCRYAGGFGGIDLEADPLKGKLKVGASGDLAYSVFEGKMLGTLYLPERNGINILELLRDVKHLQEFIDKGRQCFLRMDTEFTAKTFVGLSVAGSLNLITLNLKPGRSDEKKNQKGSDSREASTGASLSGFAGAEGSVGLQLKAQWAPCMGCFEELADIGGEWGGLAGVAGEAEIKLEWQNGRFYFCAGAKAALGLGMKGGCNFALDAKQGTYLIGHLLNAVNYHYVVQISASAFDAYKNYFFAVMVEGREAVEEAVDEAVKRVASFGEWLRVATENINEIKAQISSASRMNITLKRTPPEALGQALIVMMQTREDEDFQPILWILHSSESAHKLRWILRIVSQMDLPEESAADYKEKKKLAVEAGKQKLLDFGEGKRYGEGRENLKFLAELSGIFSQWGI